MRTFLPKDKERLFTALAVFFITLIAFETLAVTTAMPTVTTALHGSHLYALALGIVMATQLMSTAVAGVWSDTKGPHSCLYIGLTLFTTGLVFCTVAPTMEIFVVGRAIQGVGGGMCIVPFYTIVGTSIQPRNRPRILSYFAGAWILPSLFGPAIAGFIVERMSWRIIFGMTPVAIILSAPLIYYVMRKIPDIEHVKAPVRLRKLLIPSIFSGVFVGALQTMSGGQNYTIYHYLAITALFVVSLIAVRPLFPGRTFTAGRGMPATILTRIFLDGTFVGMEMFLPLLLQDVHGWSPTQAGLILSVGSITWAVGSFFSGKVKTQVRRERLPLQGLIVGVIGLIILTFGTHHAISGMFVVIGWAIAGFGSGLSYPALTVHALAISPLEKQGQASSALQVADTLGTALCAALIGIVIATFSPPLDTSLIIAFAMCVLLTAVGALISTRILPPHSERGGTSTRGISGPGGSDGDFTSHTSQNN
ncbi:MFS transporter [Actinotignum urinale]|uniref:MFS transporter n=1 Tax=Actinotignum urinale TaxID=190146 RepID=UPI0003B6D469|nr:MFS transporter [Actinotignum urinale]MDY5160298.1 MFS transporter [Actinotignum urinale]